MPVVRELRRRSGGTMRAVHLGYPRISPAHFDLVVPTPEYPVADAPNVIRVPFALSPLQSQVLREDPRNVLPRSLPFPRRLFVLGGPTLYWELPIDEMLAAVRQLLAISRKDGGSLVVIGKPKYTAPSSRCHSARSREFRCRKLNRPKRRLALLC